MKTLMLLRHAKSGWADTGATDHERSLNRRGERAAEAMADHIARCAPKPDLILCSTATRTRQTLAPLARRLQPPAPPTLLEKALYLASVDTLLHRLRTVPDDIGTVLLIGHNDGIWQLADTLARRDADTLRVTLREGFPTGTLATLSAPITRWSDLAADSAELSALVRPRDLTDR